MTTPTHEKAFPSDERPKLPMPFVLRSIHSLFGLWIVIYLFEHLLVNSQAAFLRQDDGYGFITMVNKIHALPYLKVIEIAFLGVPFLVHGIWGILYLRTARLNAHKTDGSRPALPQYRRNRAFSWQRITSWVLLVGIVAHVVHMRFIEYPTLIYRGLEKQYFVRLALDPGLEALAPRLDTQLYNNQELKEKRSELDQTLATLDASDPEERYEFREDQEWLDAAGKKPLKPQEVLAVTPNAGTAFLLIVRETFKSPVMVVLYSLLVLAAAYHGFNGLWTFMITWGITLTRRSQKRMRTLTNILMVVVAAMGLLSAWGTYLVARG